MGVDYLRIYKRKKDLNTRPIQQLKDIQSNQSVQLESPVELKKRKNSYFSFRFKRSTPSDISFTLKTKDSSLATIRITRKNTVEIAADSTVSSTSNSYPAKNRLGAKVPIGREQLPWANL